MADEDRYISYEQVLQELQTDRPQLNRLIRDGMLKEQFIDGQTRFSMAETIALKETLGKRPTVVQEGEAAPSRTDIVGEGGPPVVSKEPATEVLEGEEGEKAEVAAGPPQQVGVERDTEILEEGEELELEEPGEAPPAVTESALETDLEMAEVKVEEQAEEEAEGDFFDFSAGLEEGELELEEPAAEEEEEIITDILDLEPEEQVAEEDLLSEIMEIGEEEEAVTEAAGPDGTEDLTAEITTLEEPTYEESALDEVLEAEEEVDFGVVGEEFEVPYAAPVVVGEAQVGTGWVVALVVTLILMVLAGIFTVENSVHPDFSTGLTSWVPTD